jgi:hypothetical protein
VWGIALLAIFFGTAPTHAWVVRPAVTRRSTTTTTLALTQHEEWGIPHTQDLPPLANVGGAGKLPKALPNGGSVSLVGAGPGDPDLLTLAAARLLSDPQALVVADRLVSPEILQLVRGELKTARKWPGCAEVAQDELYAWCHEGLAAGRSVIRLKIGDPFVFGRGGEEVLQFRRWGVEATVVPVRRKEALLVEIHNDTLDQTHLLTHIPSINHSIRSVRYHTGCIGRLFGSPLGLHSGHAPRRGQPGRDEYRLRASG